MVRLEDRQWDWFRIKDFFYIQKGERIVKNDRVKGKVPLITANSINNGIAEYLEYETFKREKKVFENKITIDMFFNTFYHPYQYFSDDNVHTLIPKFTFNKFIALFLINAIKANQYKYAYGRQLRIKKLENERIKLPIDKEGKPDWRFMEDFIKFLFSNNKSLQRPSKAPHHHTQVSLKDRQWDWFRIKDFFYIQKGERIVKNDRVKGKVPLITANSINNGIAEYLEYETFKREKKVFESKITIDMFFNTFYHPYQYFSDDNVHTLIPKFTFNKFIALFLINAIKANQYKYAYGRQLRIKKLEKEKIKLPITKEGKPDWQFMEYYIKSLPYSKNLDDKKELNTQSKG